MSDLFDIATVIENAYMKCDNGDEFVAILENDARMGGYDYLVLFNICNQMWHSGYLDGIEERENEPTL